MDDGTKNTSSFLLYSLLCFKSFETEMWMWYEVWQHLLPCSPAFVHLIHSYVHFISYYHLFAAVAPVGRSAPEVPPETQLSKKVVSFAQPFALLCNAQGAPPPDARWATAPNSFPLISQLLKMGFKSTIFVLLGTFLLHLQSTLDEWWIHRYFCWLKLVFSRHDSNFFNFEIDTEIHTHHPSFCLHVKGLCVHLLCAGPLGSSAPDVSAGDKLNLKETSAMSPVTLICNGQAFPAPHYK